MKRQIPFFTFGGLIATLLLLVVLALTLWYSGGRAFSPGELSLKSQPGKSAQGFDSHASFENDCGLCHSPLKTTQDVLCMKCHMDVSSQIANQQGVHHLIQNVSACANCHPDHRGQHFDPTRFAFKSFDHSVTSFSLAWHSVDYQTRSMDCSACHDANFNFSNNVCTDCHAAEKPEFIREHRKTVGDQCVGCHDGLDSMIDFDHSKTKFPLTGAHNNTSCFDCHGELKNPPVGNTFQTIRNTLSAKSTVCADCHDEPAIHAGEFSANCEECHTTNSWSPVNYQNRLFSHDTTTVFTLVKHEKDNGSQVITCVQCHPQGDQGQYDIQICIQCHAQDPFKPDFMAKHQAQYGNRCMDCHDGVDRMINFNHNTVFVLDGRHAKAACEDCHKNQVFKDTPTACKDCHQEPDIHRGFFGLQCQYCHVTTAWSPAPLRMHIFPLDHGNEKQIACQTCHTGTYGEYTCSGCHEHDEQKSIAQHKDLNITNEVLVECAACHPDGK